jgi:hypothetical protein
MSGDGLLAGRLRPGPPLPFTDQRMPRFDDYIAYADESGDHTLPGVDPSYPMFVLAFCLTSKRDYANVLVPKVLALKFKYFGHDQVILHEHDIRKSRGPFSILLDPRVREPFYEDLNRLMEAAPLQLIASAIRKDQLIRRSVEPVNPYHLGLVFGLERLYRSLYGRGCRAGRVHILFEKRGKKEDNELELEFRRIRDGGNYFGIELPFEPVFCDKQCNSAGLQVADLVARPIGRKVLDPKQPNRAYEILKTKLRRSPAGSPIGWGLKIFP